MTNNIDLEIEKLNNDILNLDDVIMDLGGNEERLAAKQLNREEEWINITQHPLKRKYPFSNDSTPPLKKARTEDEPEPDSDPDSSAEIDDPDDEDYVPDEDVNEDVNENVDEDVNEDVNEDNNDGDSSENESEGNSDDDSNSSDDEFTESNLIVPFQPRFMDISRKNRTKSPSPDIFDKEMAQIEKIHDELYAAKWYRESPGDKQMDYVLQFKALMQDPIYVPTVRDLLDMNFDTPELKILLHERTELNNYDKMSPEYDEVCKEFVRKVEYYKEHLKRNMGKDVRHAETQLLTHPKFSEPTKDRILTCKLSSEI